MVMTRPSPMDNTPIRPDHKLLFKPLYNCQTAGCHLLVWLPKVEKRRPEGCPVAIFIHGGAFTGGGAENITYNQARVLLEQGFACLSLEYRLLPHVNAYDCRRDCFDGYLYVQNNLNDELAKAGEDIKIDATRCIASGGSAGGTLVVNLGTDILKWNQDPMRKPVPQLKAIIPAFPLTNPNKHWTGTRKEYHDKMKKESPELLELAKKVYDQKVCVSFPFPAPPPERPAKRALPPGPPPIGSDPRGAWLVTTMKLKCHNSFLYDTDPPYPPQSACVNEITPDMPPAYILAAMSDSAIPVEQSLELFDVYKAAGVEVHVGKAEGAPHAFTEVTYFWPEGCDWWEGVILPALEWAKDKAWA